MFALSVTGLARPLYTNVPGVSPLVPIEVEPPGTSTPVAALTIFTVCTAVFPGPTTRPKEVMIIGAGPTVICIPTQPVKSFCRAPSVTEVMKLVPGSTTARVAALEVTEPCELVTMTRT